MKQLVEETLAALAENTLWYILIQEGLTEGHQFRLEVLRGFEAIQPLPIA